jgi:hypothetical protein
MLKVLQFLILTSMFYSTCMNASENCSTTYNGDSSEVVSVSFYKEPIEDDNYDLDFDVVIRPAKTLNGIDFTDGAVSLGSPIVFYTNLNFYEEGGQPIAWFTSSIENIEKSEVTIRYGLECPLKVTVKPKYNKALKKDAGKNSDS